MRKNLRAITFIALLSCLPVQIVTQVIFCENSWAEMTTNIPTDRVTDRASEAIALYQLGIQQYRKGQLKEALITFQQVLPIAKEFKDRTQGRNLAGAALSNIGLIYDDRAQYPKAIEYYQQSLAVKKEVGDRAGQATTLNNIGLVYKNIGQYPKALEYYQQSLTIKKEVSDRIGEAAVFNNIGAVYDSLGQYSQALDYYQQSLAIKKEIGDRAGEGNTLNNIGLVYDSRGEYLKALDYYQRSLSIAKEVGNRFTEGTTLNNIGLAYDNLGQYPKALDYYQQSLQISQEVKDRAGEGTTFSNIGLVYDSLGQYPKALEYYQSSLKISREISDRAGEGKSLNNIGLAYKKISQYPQALDNYQQALVIAKEVGDRLGEGVATNNLGAIYRNLAQYPKALEYYQQALKIRKEIGDRAGESVTLNNIGLVYDSLEKYSQAIDYYQQSLTIKKEIGDRAGEGRTLNNIGYALKAQSQTEMAILFFKQSVSIRELIRTDLKQLNRAEQQSFTSTVADTYRTLADLLLKQGRVIEALQVLDLLTIQELEDYLKNVKGNDKTAPAVRLLEPEQAISNQLTGINNQQLTTLNQQLAKQIQQLPKSEINKVPEYLQKIPQGAVLIYPLILSDRLELIVFSTTTLPVNRTVVVKKEELRTLVTEFRAGLQDYTSEDVKASSIELYNLLIKPIAADLKQANADTILYAPDDLLRYVPLAALYDGNQWMIEKYRINNLIAYSLFDSDRQASPNLSIFVGAFGGKQGEIKFGQTALPASISEIDNIVSSFPNASRYVEQNFTAKTAREKVAGNAIVHFATHAEFKTGSPLDSYVLFGDGSKVTLAEINEWQLKDTQLVILSACQTGLGSTLASGTEILGFGYQVQRAGAKASIASLWSVSDGGTELLMKELYKTLQKGNISTSAALREAQLSMVRKPIKDGEINYNHPFFWSAFVLIGNGL